MKTIKISLCPETGIPLVPEGIKERVRNGEEISIELLHGVSGFVKNALRHGCSGLNIDECRIELREGDKKGEGGKIRERFTPNDYWGKKKGVSQDDTVGRYPKNIIIDSSEEVLAEFAKAGVRKTGGPGITQKNDGLNTWGSHRTRKTIGYEDSGSAARYYQSCPPDDHCPTCNGTGIVDVSPLDASFEEWVKDTNGTREEYERLLKPGYIVCDDCRKVDEPKGRYPKNVVHDGSEEVKAEFAKAGIRKSGGEAGKRKHKKSTCYGKYNAIEHPKETSRPPDTGLADRFFQTCPPDKPPGRYPKNVIVDGSEEVKAEFAKAGVRKSGKGGRQRSASRTGNSGLTGLGNEGILQEYNDVSTSAARFYQTCPSDPCPTCNGTKLCEVELSFDDFMNNPYEPPPEYEACPDCVICPHCFDMGVELPNDDIDDWEAYAKDPCPECRAEEPVRFKYVSKAPKRERLRGLDEMQKTVGHVAYGEYKGTPEHASNDGNPRVSTHPTQKPLSLTRYICKISRTPTGGIVLDPFLGSGTTSLAAFLEGRASIGIEQSHEYCNIAANRLAYEQSLDPDERVKNK